MKRLLSIPMIGATMALLHATPSDIGNRIELFVDRHLIAELDCTELANGRPEAREIALTIDAPWEKAAN